MVIALPASLKASPSHCCHHSAELEDSGGHEGEMGIGREAHSHQAGPGSLLTQVFGWVPQTAMPCMLQEAISCPGGQS